MAKVKIDREECKGCGLCVANCPKKILELSDHEMNAMGYYFARVADLDKCIGCAMCAMMCPDCAIEVE